MSVKCIDCGNTVELKDGSLRSHRKKPGYRRSNWCGMSGQPLSANQVDRDQGVEQRRNPGDMHEPKPYTGDLDWSPLGNDSDNE